MFHVYKSGKHLPVMLDASWELARTPVRITSGCLQVVAGICAAAWLLPVVTPVC